MKQKQVVIKVTKSEFSPVVNVIIDIEPCEQEMSNTKEPSVENIFNTEMLNVRKVCGFKQTTGRCNFECLEENPWDEDY